MAVVFTKWLRLVHLLEKSPSVRAKCSYIFFLFSLAHKHVVITQVNKDVEIDLHIFDRISTNKCISVYCVNVVTRQVSGKKIIIS